LVGTTWKIYQTINGVEEWGTYTFQAGGKIAEDEGTRWKLVGNKLNIIEQYGDIDLVINGDKMTGSGQLGMNPRPFPMKGVKIKDDRATPEIDTSRFRSELERGTKIRKTGEKPQGTTAELRDYARKYIEMYFTKCAGDSLYSYAYDAIGGRQLLEIKNLLITVSSEEVSKAESLNGLEGQGTLYIEPEAYRTYDFSNSAWSEWKDGRVGDGLRFGVIHTIYWHMVKRNRAWAKKDVAVIPGIQASNRDYLTNTKVKVKCDNIAAPLPAWTEDP
jgi:hypothetical protein